MFPTGPQTSREEKQLLKHFKVLGLESRKSLMDFAEFLSGRVEPENIVPTLPLDIPRPETESVVKAIKRLTATYPMIDRSKLFNDTSALMSKHVMQGVLAEDVIDELEQIFKKFYTESAEVKK